METGPYNVSQDIVIPSLTHNHETFRTALPHYVMGGTQKKELTTPDPR